MNTKIRWMLGSATVLAAILLVSYFSSKGKQEISSDTSDAWNTGQSRISLGSGEIEGSAVVKKYEVIWNLGMDGKEVKQLEPKIEPNDPDNPVNSPENPKNQPDG